jgi:hypothetical protein
MKGRFAMIRKLFLFLSVATLSIQPVYPQTRAVESGRQIKAGEFALFGDTVRVKVTRSTKSPFTSYKLKGEPVVVVVELDGGKKGVTLSYNLTTDSRSSELSLLTGAMRNAPRAVIEDFPSWGSDNDKEVEILDPAETDGSVSLSFEGKGTLTLLFDIAAAQAKSPMRLSVKLRTLKPQEEEHSFIVNL